MSAVPPERNHASVASRALDQCSVLVIGGSGVSGRHILADLHRHAPGLRLCAGGRAETPPQQPPLPAGVDWLRIDINAMDPTVLRNFDVVVIAAGPFERFRDAAHIACITAGVDAVDINDSLVAASAIHALDASARTAGVRIVTGAGLSPGLSGLLLAGLRAQHPHAVRLDSTLYMGAKNAGGSTAPLALFGGFRRHQPQWHNGTLSETATDWRKLGEPHHFPHLDRAIPCVPQASPELTALARSAQGLREIRHRFHVQGLPSVFARLCAALGLERRPKLAQWLAARMHATSAGVARKPASSMVCSLCVTDMESGEQWRVHGEIPAYHLTASVASMFVLALLKGDLEVAPGVQVPEWLAAQLDWRAALALRGVIVECGQANAPFDWPQRIGASSPCYGEPQTLRHYGQCWYSLRIPPWVQRWQMRCLSRSELYIEIKRRCSLPKQVVLITCMLFGWYRNTVSARKLNAFGVLEDSKPAAAMRRDFAMFAAGYKQLRKLLGGDAAHKLYMHMFLQTGAMEMAWLTPSADVFAAQPNPGAALSTYLLAYFKAYADLEAIELKIESKANSVALHIRRCAFARLFMGLDTPELAPLVRRMEAAHFGAIATSLGLHLGYRDHSGGLASFTLNLDTCTSTATEAIDDCRYT